MDRQEARAAAMSNGLRAVGSVTLSDEELVQPIRCGRREFAVCPVTGELEEFRHADAFEMRHLRGRWWLEVPYRHLTYGWPVLWKVRLRRAVQDAGQV